MGAPGLYIGTSGWAYGHWRDVFYAGVRPADRLRHYAAHFPTVEVNYSFYHLPRPATYAAWHDQTPEGFVFAVKASRVITHLRRLRGVEGLWANFLEGAARLREKLGPLLLQFPPVFGADSGNLAALEAFLAAAGAHPLALEFRHAGWCRPEVYDLLRARGAAWVVADSPRYPKAEEVTADFVYVRLHGSREMFSSCYTGAELAAWAAKIRAWRGAGRTVYVYFNNDAAGFAVTNARELAALLAGQDGS